MNWQPIILVVGGNILVSAILGYLAYWLYHKYEKGFLHNLGWWIGFILLMIWTISISRATGIDG